MQLSMYCNSAKQVQVKVDWHGLLSIIPSYIQCTVHHHTEKLQGFAFEN